MSGDEQPETLSARKEHKTTSSSSLTPGVETAERDIRQTSYSSGRNLIQSPTSTSTSHHANGEGNAAAEHLRYGRVEYEHFEDEDEADKRRHYLIRRPKLKQWFYKGKLYRSAEGRASARIELFFDLIFVAIIAVLAEAAIEEPTGDGLVKYLVTYWAAYSIWSGLRESMNMFWNDDVLQKSFVMWIMILLITFGNNAPFVNDVPHEEAEEPVTGTEGGGGEAAERLLRRSMRMFQNQKRAEAPEVVFKHHYEGGGRTTAITVYIVAAVSLLVGRLVYSIYVHQVRTQLRLQCALTIVPLALYIGAIFTSVRAAIALVVVGLAFEYLAWVFVYSPTLKKLLKLEYSSALNIEHEIERHADFFTIVIGEFIYSSISGAPAGLGIDRATGRAALVLLIAASIQLLHMFGSGSVHFSHPLRHSGSYATLWFALHLPAVAALTLAGDAGAVLIGSATGVPQGVRWFFCAGLAVGVFSTACLAALEQEEGECILLLRKRYRIVPRFLVPIVLVFLPLADETALSSNSLTGIAAALLYGTLIYETIAGLHRREHVTGKSETGLRKYFPQFFDPGLAHRDVHKPGEEVYDEDNVDANGDGVQVRQS